MKQCVWIDGLRYGRCCLELLGSLCGVVIGNDDNRTEEPGTSRLPKKLDRVKIRYVQVQHDGSRIRCVWLGNPCQRICRRAEDYNLVIFKRQSSGSVG